MANVKGSKNKPILIDDDDDREYRPAPRIASYRRRSQAFRVTQDLVDLTIESDDDQDVVEAAPVAWSAAQSRRRSGHSSSDVGQAGPSTPRRESNAHVEVVSCVPPAKLDPPDPQDTIDDEEGVAPAWEEEEQGNPAGNEPSAAQITSSPSNHFLAGLPERTKLSQPSKVDGSPSRSARAVAKQTSSSTSQQPQPELSVATIRPHRQGRARTSSSISSLIANSSLNDTPASTATGESELPTMPLSNPQPPDTSSAHTASASGSIQDGLRSMPAGVQKDQNAPQNSDGSESPIGEIADHRREQTTSGRVNNAPTTERSVERPGTTVLMPTNSRATQGPTIAAAQRNQRAVKSVRRTEEGRVVSSKARPYFNQHSQASAKEGSLSRGARQQITVTEDSNGAVQPGDRNLGTVTKPKSTAQPETLGMAVQALSEPARASSSSGDGRTQRLSSIRTTFGQLSAASPAQNATSEARAIASSSRHELSLSDNGLPADYQNHNTQGHRQTTPEIALSIDATDLSTARLTLETCLRQRLIDRHESHANLTGSQMWRQRTCHERELRAQYHMRMGPHPPALPEKYLQTISPFESMSSIQVPFDKTTSSGPYQDISQEIFSPNKPKDTTRSGWAVRPIMYKSEAIRIPSFKEYVFLKDSILADNETKLLATPYLQDDDDERHTELVTELPRYYEMKHDTNASSDVRSEQCRFYKGVIDTFLRMVGVSWDSILFWLLAPEQEIKRINGASSGWPSFETFLLDRSDYHLENFMRDEKNQTAVLFDRDSEKWKSFCAQLELPSTEQCRLSAIACAAVLKECGFSIWYLARQSETLQRHISKKLLAPVASSKLTFRDIVCRVCHQHNCLLHGELRQVPEDFWKDDIGGELGDEPAHFDDDSDIEKVINYKVPRNPDAFNIHPESEMIESRGSNPPRGKFDRKWWTKHSHTQWEHRKPFFPCSHEGSCEQAECRCFRENITCEKTCKCSKDCQRRFPGCNCASKPKKRLCRGQECICVAFNRECDADLCGTCGAVEILDPVNRFNEDMLKERCTNVAIQRGVPRKTFLGHSEVHGFGLYIGEDIKMDDYIGEYTGETISVSEGNRRSIIYGYQRNMYLFTLDQKQEVDATYMGNKLRFINNADDHLTNCKPKNLLCNTVFRLALYASTDIKAGSELFFHYNYPKETTKGFKQPTSVAKQKAKKAAKSKGKIKLSKSTTYKKSSTSSSRTRTSNRPLRTLTGLVKARSSRAEKQKAKLIEESTQESTSSHSKGLQKARKTAIDQGSGPRRPPTILPRTTRGIRTVRRSDDPDESPSSNSSTDDEEAQETQDPRLAQEIQETDDEEDDDFSLDEVQESASESESSVADEEDTAVEDSDNSSMRSTRSRTQRSVPMAQVVAMKKIVGQRSRPARKRKRVIANSDDE